MLKPIIKPIDSKDLPRWARNHDAVIWLCQLNLGYRQMVFDCKTRQMRQWLKRKAEVTLRMFDRKNPIREIG